MGKGWIVLVFLLAILAAAGIWAYYFYEKPKQDQETIVYTNLSIETKDADTGALIPALFSVQQTGYQKFGNTNTMAFTLQKVKSNESFLLFVWAEGYYTELNMSDAFLSDVRVPQNVRISVPMKKIGNVTISHQGVLGVDNPIILNITKNGEVREVKLCLRWSNNILTVSVRNTTNVDKEPRIFNKVDKCYLLNETSLSNQTQMFFLDYRRYAQITQDDSIKVYALYGNIDRNTTQYSFSDGNLPMVRDDLIYTMNAYAS